MGKVTSSANKEKSTNSYAKNNQAAIKALATVGKVGATVGKVLIKPYKKVYDIIKKPLDDRIKKQKQKDMEAIDV